MTRATRFQTREQRLASEEHTLISSHAPRKLMSPCSLSSDVVPTKMELTNPRASPDHLRQPSCPLVSNVVPFNSPCAGRCTSDVRSDARSPAVLASAPYALVLAGIPYPTLYAVPGTKADYAPKTAETASHQVMYECIPHNITFGSEWLSLSLVCERGCARGGELS